MRAGSSGLPRRGLLAVVALSSIAGCVTTPAERPSLSVLSYNIHHGEGTDGEFDLLRIAGVIERSGADLVALQEVDVRTSRASGVDQAQTLAGLTGMHVAFGEAIPFAGGSYGDAVLSRWPIERWKAHRLPASEGHELRVAVEVIVEPPGVEGPVRFISTHLDHTKDPADRIAQAEALVALFPEDGIPSLLVGDLNAEPDSEPMGILFRAGWSPADPASLPTFPSKDAEKKIDWILFRSGSSVTSTAVRVLQEPLASDHAPLHAVLSWSQP